MKRLTAGIGVDRAIDCVGLDACCAHAGPAKATRKELDAHREEVQQIAPRTHVKDGNWKPGDAPSQALEWAVDALAKAGTLSIVGVYGDSSNHFPLGRAMNKNLSVNMGNCNHRKYIPELIQMVRSGGFQPSRIVTQKLGLESAIEAYQHFDLREPGWTKVELEA